jgi:hypothetical protein
MMKQRGSIRHQRIDHSNKSDYEVFMKTRRRKSVSLPTAMTNLTLASWETISRRMLLISQNRCSPAEYQRMVSEKAQAAMASGMALISGKGQFDSIIAPWLNSATANAKRLRKK